jgi:hypothetical protein
LVNRSRGWNFAAIVAEREPVSLDGVDPWTAERVHVDEPAIVVPHPEYPWQTHTLTVYEVRTNGRTVKFAAGEVSANVYIFYLWVS